MPDTTSTQNPALFKKVFSPLKSFLGLAVAAILLLGLFVLCPLPASAAGGDKDAAFSGTVTTTSSFVLASAVQTDGKIIIAGDFTNVNGTARNRIARLNTDGSLDTSFNPNANGTIRALALQPDGKVVVGGDFTNIASTGRNRIARLNSNGSIDSTFNPNANGIVRALALQSDGKILVGGSFVTMTNTTVNKFVRLNSAGTIDAAFAPGNNVGSGANGMTTGDVWVIAQDGSGNILAGGDFSAIRTVNWNRIARFSSTNGALDTSFGASGTNGITNGIVRAFGIQSDGKIVVGGSFTQYDDVLTNNRLIRVKSSDGLKDATFTGTANGDVLTIKVLPNDELYLGGGFTSVSGTLFNRIARLQKDSAPITTFLTFGTGRGAANNNIYTISLQPDGRVIAGGNFTTFNGSTANARIVRLDGLSGAISFSGPTTITAPEGTSPVLTATRIGGIDGFITATVLITNVTTTSGDYTAPSSPLSWVWSASDPATKTFTLPITLDASPELTETFNVGFQITSGSATITNPNTMTVTIPAQFITTTLNLTQAPNPTSYGQSAIFTATVTGCCGFPLVNTGAVTFTEGATILAANVPVDANGVATFITNTLAVGSHNITAVYNSSSGSGFLSSSGSAVHFVTGALLQTISVTPITATMPAGASQIFYATGNFSDGSTQDISSSANWSSSNPAVASQSTNKATGLASGTTTVRAVYTSTNGTIVTGTATLTVTQKVLNSITVTSTRAVIAKGENEQFYAVANYSDGTTADVSSTVSWTSSVITVATVVSNSGLATAVNPGTTIIAASTGTLTGTKTLYVTQPELTGLYIQPNFASIPKGNTQQFLAYGTYSDGIDRNLSTVVSWTTSNPAFATINTSGLANGVAPGTVIVTATTGVFSATATLQVRNADLVGLLVSPPSATTPQGTSVQYTAVGQYSDNTTGPVPLSWSTSDGAIATINGVTGRATGVAPGTVTIIATSGAVTGTATLNITSATPTGLVITPVTASVAAGLTVQYSAVVTYSDNTTRTLTSAVNWSTANASVATIATNGLLTGQNTGTTTVTATLGMTLTSNVATINVTAPTLTQIVVNPPNAFIGTGATVTFTATGIDSKGQSSLLNSAQVDWLTGNGAIASIGPGGVAVGMSVGSTVITASLKANPAVRGTANITVGPPVVTQVLVGPTSATVPLGATAQFTATARFSDNTTQDITTLAQWSSLNPAIASVNSSGLASGVGNGSTTIQAMYQGITGTAAITVTSPVIVSIDAKPDNVVLARGQSLALAVTAYLSDGTTTTLTTGVNWVSGSPGLVSVSSSGVITGLNLGSTTVTATYNSLSDAVMVNVVGAQLQSLTIGPSSASIGQGASLQYAATGNYSDGTTENLTSLASWFSSNAGAATINASGIASGVAPGTTTITATYQGVTSNPATLNVINATVVSLAVSPTNRVIPNGTSLNYEAIATLSNGLTQTLATGVNWSSSVVTVASITGNGPATATAQNLGSTTIQAVYAANPTISNSTTLVVSDALLQSLTITPNPANAVTGQKVVFVANGLYSDGQTRDVTSLVSWSSLNNGVATISNTPGTKGVATAVGLGSTTIQAMLGSISNTATINVSIASTTIALIATPAFGANFGQNVVFSATVKAVAPGAGFPTPGVVQFYDSATPLGSPVAVDGAGVATFNISTLPGGAHTIRAQFSSQNPNYADSGFANLDYFIGKDSTTTSLSVQPSPSSYGQSITLTAQVIANSGVAAGVVSFTYGSGAFIGTANLAGNFASLSVPNLNAGVYSFTATYLGNASYNASASDIVFHIVNKLDTTTNLTISPPVSATFNQSVTFTATVSSAVGTPGGMVNFFNGQSLLFSASLNGAGQAVYVTNTLPTGSYSLTAQYTGAANYLPSASGSLPYAIVAANAVQLLVTEFPSPTLAGTTDFFRVTVKDQFGNVATGYTGTVSFSSDDLQATFPTAYSFTSQDAGTKLFTATLRTAGTHTITVTDGLISGAQTGIVVNAANPVIISATVGSGQVQNSGLFFTDTLQATLLDSFGNPVGGRVVTFTAPVSSTGSITGLFENGSSQYVTTTNSAGVATALRFRAGVNTGSYFVVATTAGINQGANFTLTNIGTNCNPLLVTFKEDDASGTNCGTLSYAFTVAFNANKPVTITIAPSVGVLELTKPLAGVPAGGVIIDGGCQNGVPQTTLRPKAGSGVITTGLTLTNGGVARGLIFNGFSGYAIEMKGTTNRAICNYIGNVDGSSAPNGGGIHIYTGSNNNVLGELNNPTSGNIIADNTGSGLLVDSNSKNNLLYYNLLGYGSDGTTLRPNSGGSLKLNFGGQLKFRVGNRIV